MYPCPAYDRAVWGIVVRCFRRWVVVLSNGRKGGLLEYARQVGRGENRIREWTQAASVVKNCANIGAVFDSTYQLAAIHAAPQELWPVFVEALLGLHALASVELGKGGAGRKGGVSVKFYNIFQSWNLL